MATNISTPPYVPVSWGELIDKITILEIKSQRMSGSARENVARELALLEKAAGLVAGEQAISALRAQLKTVNESLWQTEDRLREKDKAGEFDKEFVALARSVYADNDSRAAIKRRINLELRSEIMEEKSYGAPNPELSRGQSKS